jgi:hypothetical protein
MIAAAGGGVGQALERVRVLGRETRPLCVHPTLELGRTTDEKAVQEWAAV